MKEGADWGWKEARGGMVEVGEEGSFFLGGGGLGEDGEG